MKKCPYCAEEIQEEAIICKHCKKVVITPQKPKSKGGFGKLAAGIILFIVFAFIITTCLNSGGGGTSNSGNEARRYTSLSSVALQKNIDECKSLGVLKKIELGNYYYVDPTIWNQLNIDAKKGMCMNFADYANSKGDKTWCEVKDYITGKKLAKLNSWGFETY